MRTVDPLEIGAFLTVAASDSVMFQLSISPLLAGISAFRSYQLLENGQTLPRIYQAGKVPQLCLFLFETGSRLMLLSSLHADFNYEVGKSMFSTRIWKQ